MPRTYADSQNPGDFVTEDDDGTTREATPEEVEDTLEEWEQLQKDNKGYNDNE